MGWRACVSSLEVFASKKQGTKKIKNYNIQWTLPRVQLFVANTNAHIQWNVYTRFELKKNIEPTTN